MADEAVLVVAFNRPRFLEQVLERLRTTGQRRLYVAIDGPREGHPTDSVNVQACRELVEAIDWTNDIRTLFRSANLGCGKGVSSAITWFLDDAGRGIILEDDTLPRDSFFPFCSELLDRYQDDPRVLAISGCNFVPPEFQTGEHAYRFSQIPHIWGWATWHRAWQIHDLDISGWRRRMPKGRLWQATGGKLGAYAYWRSIFDLQARQAIDTWDMQLVFHAMANGMLTATSNVNLVDNIGWGAEATHTERRPPYLRQSEEITLPTSPVPVDVDRRADDWSARVVFEASTTGLIAQGARHLARRSRALLSR